MAWGFAGPVSERADSGTCRFGKDSSNFACVAEVGAHTEPTAAWMQAARSSQGKREEGKRGRWRTEGTPLRLGSGYLRQSPGSMVQACKGARGQNPCQKTCTRAWRAQANPGDCRNAKIMPGDWGVNPVLNLGATIGLGSGVPRRRPALGVDQRGSGYPCRLGGRGAWFLSSIDHDVRLRSTKGRADWEGARSRLGC